MVIDAGVVLALVLPLPYSEAAATKIRLLVQEREQLFAPALLEYEVCSALRRAVARNIIDDAAASRALELIDALRIRPITPAWSLHKRALSWASRLGQTKAYDAQYLALAEQMKCELLTADLRLARTAQVLGADWVTGLD
jgi:predicted nucleic acid-binding protein